MRSGDVVVLNFPFSDLSGSKPRPAVILAGVGGHDFIACQVTSNSGSDPHSIRLAGPDFSVGGLRTISFVRPGKLFTAHRSIIGRTVGRLIDKVRDDIKTATIGLVRAG